MNADQEMLDLFVQESSEHLQTLETDLIALESNPEDSALLNSIFRSVHSIKGASGFFGFDPIVKLAHVMESVMSLLRDGTIGADQAMVSLLISTSDKLNLMLAQADRAAEIPCDDEIAGLQAILNGTPLQGHKPPASVAPKPIAAAASVTVAQDDNLPDAGLADFAFDPSSLVDGLKHGQNF